ncbi:hypothetical protein [Cupriavidus sp. AU9028]|uniref:hypothetical protein n=1 Tax=Cupriavidus sp. AU9028 TaxID=2871157 RepID=UPI002103231B|nr:hypothetical protein [Cupriavidus sp. AU9028]
MYVVAVGWLYVALMMAITEHTAVAGVATFVLYGVVPVSIVLYIMGTPGRRRRRKAREAWAAREAQKASGDGLADGQERQAEGGAPSGPPSAVSPPDRARSTSPSGR